MTFTPREKLLNTAHEQGVRDFENNNAFDASQYGDDIGMMTAYRAGWNQAQRDYNSFYNCSYD
jgi:hypothetical protein